MKELRKKLCRVPLLVSRRLTAIWENNILLVYKRFGSYGMFDETQRVDDWTFVVVLL